MGREFKKGIDTVDSSGVNDEREERGRRGIILVEDLSARERDGKDRKMERGRLFRIITLRRPLFMTHHLIN